MAEWSKAEDLSIFLNLLFSRESVGSNPTSVNSCFLFLSIASLGRCSLQALPSLATGSHPGDEKLGPQCATIGGELSITHGRQQQVLKFDGRFGTVLSTPIASMRGRSHSPSPPVTILGSILSTPEANKNISFHTAPNNSLGSLTAYNPTPDA
ncbi:hypothetical protein VTI74DRAFT_32 [Chaetomium olivicolor]